MNCIGIDIGSTASKVYGIGKDEFHFVLPSGWNSKETAGLIAEHLMEQKIDVRNPEHCYIVATGYGRGAVEYATKAVTEITCHGMGGQYLANNNITIVDIGGQDTKIILLENGKVSDFLMNDKCSAGTGKFVEVMANRLNVTIPELFDLAQRGTAIPVSSVCTVFAESEIINFMQEGKQKEDIAAGVIDSVANKVVSLCARKNISEKILLTGGLSNNSYFAQVLGGKLKKDVMTHELGRYAGAIGAALIAKKELNL